jgi:subtilisin family serine protease
MFKVVSGRRSDVLSVTAVLSVVLSFVFSTPIDAQPARSPLSSVFAATASANDLIAAISGRGILRQMDKVSRRALSETVDGKSASVVILLEDQADVSSGYEIADDDERGWYVYSTLTAHATRTQESLKSFLKQQGRSYRSFWAANMIVAEVDRSLLMKVAERGDVARIDSNQPTRWIEEPEVANRKAAISDPANSSAIEWGVTNVNAPSVWGQGFTGQGIVIGGLDTGIRWTHTAIKTKYRGWNGSSANHNYNWWDAIHASNASCAANTTVPCDDDGHGTGNRGRRRRRWKPDRRGTRSKMDRLSEYEPGKWHACDIHRVLSIYDCTDKQLRRCR